MAANKDAAPEKSAEELIAEARAEAERIIAEARAAADAIKGAEPAPEAPKEKKTDPMEELVEYTAPLAPAGERQDILAAVNGEAIRIMRGERVPIKRKYVEVLENAARQQVNAQRTMQRAQREGTRALADM